MRAVVASTVRAAFCCALGALIALLAGRAWAVPGAGAKPVPVPLAEDQVIVTFLVDTESAPTNVCFLSDWWDLGWLSQQATKTDVVIQDVTEWADKAAKVQAAPSPDPSLEKATQDLLAKLSRRRAAEESGSCGPESYCQPRFPFYQQALDAKRSAGSAVPAVGGQHLVLVCSGYRTDRDSKTVVLEVTPARKDLTLTPQLAAPRMLGGTAAALSLTNLPGVDKGDREKFGIRVIGGDYLEDTTGANIDRKISLSVVPRCQKRTVELPAGVGSQNLEVFLSGTDAPICQNPKVRDRRWFQLWLPNYQGSETNTLRVKTEDGERQATALDSWSTQESPAVLRPRLSEVRFSWRPDCMYRGTWNKAGELEAGSCPQARLTGGAVSCDHSKGPEPGVCYYTCGAESGRSSQDAGSCWKGQTKGGSAARREITFDLPVRAQFCHAGDDFWEEDLSYAGQELSGFVPASQRHVEVDLSSWETPTSWQLRQFGDKPREPGFFTKLVTERPAAVIRLIVLRDPGGVNHHIVPGPGQRVLVPGARCGDVLTYDIDGERGHEPGYVTIEHGRVALPRPEEVEHKWSFWAAMSGALSTDMVTGGGFFQPARRGYRNEDWRPSGMFHAGIAWRHPGWPLSLEFGFTYMLGPQPYFPIQTSTSIVDSREVPYSHFGGEWSIVWFPPCKRKNESNAQARVTECKNFAFGAGGGVLVANALRTAEDSRVGTWQAVPVLTAILARWYWTQYVALQMSARVFFGEKIQYHTIIPGGGVRANHDSTTSFQLEIGVRVGP